MKISVIVPVYNCEKYLEACVNSILTQTHTDLEVILVNDGSLDSSPKICDTFVEADARVQVIHQENRGVSAARNAGLALASGDLVSFIDGDDTLEPDMYQLLISYLEDPSVSIAHCGYKHVVGDEIRLVHDTKQIYEHNTEQALHCLVGQSLFVGSLWNKLYRKELLTGIRFREDLKINEDILFNFEAFRRAKRSVFADYAKYNYIAHMDSSACFVTPSEKQLQDSCTVNAYIYEELKNNPALSDDAGQRYLRSLCGYYRYCVQHDRGKCQEITDLIGDVARTTTVRNRNLAISVMLIRFFPTVYPTIYAMYRKVRKANWEV